MGPRAALVLLAFLLASASGAYVTSTYNYVVDSSLANSVTNGAQTRAALSDVLTR